MSGADPHRFTLTQEKLLLIGALFVGASLGYYFVAPDSEGATTLRTSLDDAIPFAPRMQWFYAWVYTAMFYPAFVIADRALFRRVCLAYGVTVALSLVCFAAFPVTSVGLRGDPTLLDMSRFELWGLRANYALDPPTNLFPSLHLSSATLATLSAWRARRLWGLLALPVLCAIAAAICMVKQHYVVDGVAGVALGASAFYLLVHRPSADLEGPELATGWRGPAAYLAFHASTYLGLYAAFRLGWKPWES